MAVVDRDGIVHSVLPRYSLYTQMAKVNAVAAYAIHLISYEPKADNAIDLDGKIFRSTFPAQS